MRNEYAPRTVVRRAARTDVDRTWTSATWRRHVPCRHRATAVTDWPWTARCPTRCLTARPARGWPGWGDPVRTPRLERPSSAVCQPNHSALPCIFLIKHGTVTVAQFLSRPRWCSLGFPYSAPGLPGTSVPRPRLSPLVNSSLRP